MFGQLPASRPGRSFGKGEWTGLVGASVLHVSLLLLGGASAGAVPTFDAEDTIPIIFTRPLQQPEQSPKDPGGDVSPVANPGFAVDWPEGALPDLDLTAALVEVDLGLDPRDLIGRSAPTAPLGGTLGAPLRGAKGSIREESLDVPMRVLRAPDPIYPEWLRRAGITGVVTVEFVVDTAGSIEPESIEVIRADRREFVDAVFRSLHRARFSPGTVRGKPVRVMVRQDFRFRIGR